MSAITNKPAKLNASHVKAALRLRYADPEYATLEEVRNATGLLKKRQGKKPRYADMIAMGVWPSSGLEILGFEVKVSRADWLVELSDEKKAVPVMQFCDRWYLVTNSEKIVKEGELPESWGWLVVDMDFRVRVMKEAPKLDAKPITREFLASLLRNATRSNPDYLEVQAKVIQSTPAPQSRGARRDFRRKATTVTAATKRMVNRRNADALAAACAG